jgi:hypothetical protein
MDAHFAFVHYKGTARYVCTSLVKRVRVVRTARRT